MLKRENENDLIMEYIDQPDSTDRQNITDDLDSNNLIIPGIDLGTTNSCISIWRNGNCEIIPDEWGNKTIPSFVAYTNVSKYVGLDAKNQKDINVENVFYEVKRLIGRTYDEKYVQDIKDMLSYRIVKNDRGCCSLQSSVRNNKTFTPEEISASVLMKLKDMACKYLKRDVQDVVITIPAHFNDSQRQATYDASKIAGLNCVRMINEPTASALAYGMMDRSISKKNNPTRDGIGSTDQKDGMMVLVYDFGGGTLDISVIDIYDGCFDVKGSSGISYFGGVDFDNRLINYCMAKFSRQYGYSKVTEQLEINSISRIALQKLRTQCESAKKILSTNNSAYIAVEDFHENKDLFVKITRDDFENICRDLFLLCLHPVEEILDECMMTENDIDEVILVGGMTRMPHIREMLNNKFKTPDGKSKVNCSINPDEAISIGASIQGYIIANRDNAFSDSVTLMDITPLSLGVEVIGGVMDTLIRRNTMIPCEKTKMYSTDSDYVESVLVKIFEGERALTMFNYKIGEFELDKIPKCQRGVPEIEITFAIDINGIVTVTALEKDVNEKKSIVVNTNRNGLKQQQLKALIDEAVEQETMDEINRVKKFSYYEIEDLCSNIRCNINNKEFTLTQRDITTITEDIDKILVWLKEKKFNEREMVEYDDTLHKMKKKYGVLILQGRIDNDRVKGNAEHMEATTLYGKDDDEEEEEMRQAFEKVRKDEIGGSGMTDSEITEIKEMRNALMELCRSVNNILCSGKLNLTEQHKQEIMYYIDDVMLWYYSHEKPTKLDYKEKIDHVNSICDEIVESYQKEGKELFKKVALDSDKDYNSQKLEKLCLTLLTMIQNKQIKRAPEITSKIQNILKCIYEHVEPNNSDEEFQNKCGDLIVTVNQMCDEMYNNQHNFNFNSGSTIVQPKTNIVTDQFTISKKTGDQNDGQECGKGMSIMELMRMRQNEEIDQMIENQISDDQNV
jgi:heat shock protein 1/8